MICNFNALWLTVFQKPQKPSVNHFLVQGHCYVEVWVCSVSMTSFWCLYCKLWTYFTPCSSVSIVNFEQVNADWDNAEWDCYIFIIFVIISFTEWHRVCVWYLSLITVSIRSAVEFFRKLLIKECAYEKESFNVLCRILQLRVNDPLSIHYFWTLK